MSVRVAVVGAGTMGRNHARVYANLPNADLVGVADSDESVAKLISERYGAQQYTDYRRMLDDLKPEAVTVAVPTVDHLQVALEVISRGAHLLIEKPLAFDLEEGRRIIEAAASADVQLMVGHIERFNPAVMALESQLSKGELGRVFQLDARRLGPFPYRVKDVGVVIDLAVHDLDVMRYVTGANVIRVFAETERRIHSSREDLLAGLLRFDDGSVATLAVNWLTPTKIRELAVTGERGMFRVDYLTQDLYFFENARAQDSSWEALQVLRGVSEGRMVRYVIEKREPMLIELEAFLAAVEGRANVPTSGEDGLRVLEIAHALATSGRERRVVKIGQLDGQVAT